MYPAYTSRVVRMIVGQKRLLDTDRETDLTGHDMPRTQIDQAREIHADSLGNSLIYLTRDDSAFPALVFRCNGGLSAEGVVLTPARI
jgi:hypothetical protein